MMFYRYLILLSLSILSYAAAYHHSNNTVAMGIKKFLVNKLATRGFGRVLTWNVKKLGACLRQDNVAPLKEAVCVVLQSANLIVLQEASNLDFSCLPCNTVLKDEYDWPGNEGNEDFKVLIKTKHSRSFSIKKTGSCESLDDLNIKRSVEGKSVQKMERHSNANKSIEFKKHSVNRYFRKYFQRTRRYIDDASQILRFLKNDNTHARLDENIKAIALDGLDKQSQDQFIKFVARVLEIKKLDDNIENNEEQKVKSFSGDKKQNSLNNQRYLEIKSSKTEDLTSQDILNIIDGHLINFKKEIDGLNLKISNISTTPKLTFQDIMNSDDNHYNTNKKVNIFKFGKKEPKSHNIKRSSKSYYEIFDKKTKDKLITNIQKTRSLIAHLMKQNKTKKNKEKALKRQLATPHISYTAKYTPQDGVLAIQGPDMTVMLPKALQPETVEPEKVIKSPNMVQESGDQRVIDSQSSNPAPQPKVVHKPNYVIYTVKSDLNSGDPFILANVRFPKGKHLQRACMAKIAADIANVNSQAETSYKKIIAGDFHMDRLSGSDDKGDMYKILTNLQIEGENFHSPLTYGEKDPITTVYGRRFDNIIANLPLKGNLKAIGPDFPLEPEAVVMPFILQRLYNNYMTSLYTSDNDESDSIYECIKAFQMAGKAELQNSVCKDIWTPSSYISDHLPLELRVSLKVSGRSSPVELRLASWNIQGDTFKERLLDPDVKRGFIQRLKKYHMAVFHEFPPHDRILDDQELGGSDVVRLKQGDLTTEFGIYISEYIKDGETDMYILRKKFKGEDVSDVLINPTREEAENMVTTVGLFAPRIVIDTYRLQPCFYTVRTSEKHRSNGIDFEKIIGAIDKDVQTRKCDFKLLMASLNLEDEFDIDKVVYDKFKFINLKCQISDGDLKYKYNVPRSRDLADYIILLEKDPSVEFSECKIGLPGDEGKRGIDKLSDFEELTTHYPFSVVLRRHD
ncbi:uncharacterized protein LOC105849752 isoform X2 [Hydra vulgaris]|uniref:Uncharacterized protein LOC105849752 isoform X2 n=1 Tax=Hydra vulgaris TaxID=6087 RepID=A0ABM4CDA9_HYDVU